jgi:Fe-Mn family superoxide dismutase
MRYQIAPLFCRPWTLLGITPRLIESHYENNYGGAFTRLNAISEELEALDPATTPPHVIRRLKQDEAAALNSLALHELYFASLGGDGRAVPEVMANALARDFGSVDRWRGEFVALANSLDGGSGWVLLSWLPRAGRLVNQSICDGSHAVAGAITVLALDMYEHAYHLDFGPNTVSYVATFMRNIDWSAVQGRYEDAVGVKPPRRLEQKQFGDLPSVTVEEVKADARLRNAGADYRYAAPALQQSFPGHDGGSDLARPRPGRRVDGRTLEERAGRHVLRLRVSRRMPNGDSLAQGRI